MESLADAESRDAEKVTDLIVIQERNSMGCVSQLKIKMLREKDVSDNVHVSNMYKRSI